MTPDELLTANGIQLDDLTPGRRFVVLPKGGALALADALDRRGVEFRIAEVTS